jgi:AcrR family transcriptional regulator
MTPSRTRLPAAERRETILRAATEVFAEAGYRAGKVSDVAARVGVTEPVIFQNFGSKAALFAAVLDRAAAEVRASMDGLATAFGSASGLLAHVLSPSSPHPHPGEPATGPADHAGAGHAEVGHTGAGHAATDHTGAAYGVLFADAAALTAEPELDGPARDAFRAIAAHLADLIRRAQADGDGSADPGERPPEPPEDPRSARLRRGDLGGADPGGRPPRDLGADPVEHSVSPEASTRTPWPGDPAGPAERPPGDLGGADPEAAAWLVLSVLAARRLRAAAMPAGLEPAVTGLALRALGLRAGPS